MPIQTNNCFACYDEEDELFEDFVASINGTSLSSNPAIDDDENEEALFEDFCNQAKSCSFGEDLYVTERRRKRHEFVSCSELSTPSIMMSSTSSSSSVEEESSSAKLTLIRGKAPRAKTNTTGSAKVLKKRTEYLEDLSISTALVPCCSKMCNERFTFSDVKTAREQFWALSSPNQQDWLTRHLSFWGTPDENTGIFKFKYVLQDIPCCSTFLENALPVSHGRLSNIRHRVLVKKTEDTSVTGSPVSGPKADAAEAFIREYAQTHGSAMPHKKDIDLPSGLSKDKVYIEYLLTYPTEEASRQACSLSYWYKIWSERCFHVKVRKWHRFSKCSVCSNIKVLREFSNANSHGK